MSILFIGDLNEYGRSFMRFQTLKRMGHEVTGISMVPVPHRPGIEREPVTARIFSKIGIPRDETGANRTLWKAIQVERYDLVWIEKGNTIHPATLRAVRAALPSARLINVSEDDMCARHNRSRYYTRNIPLYDVIFTTKVYNLEELKRLGAKQTELFLDSFDETLHRPAELSGEERKRFGAEVGFIGTFEKERAEAIRFLEAHGVSVRVWGNGWGGSQPLYGEEYVKAVNATKINLCFLRKMNRDEVTSRSLEIPACGAFMLAERTKRHQEFFTEGKEAAFFGSNEELLSMVHRYLSDEVARRRIATAGRERCLKGGYSMKTQLSSIIARVEENLRMAR